MAKKAVLRKELKLEEFEQLRLASIQDAKRREEDDESSSIEEPSSHMNYGNVSSSSQILTMLETIVKSRDAVDSSKLKEMVNCLKCKASLRPAQLKVVLRLILLFLFCIVLFSLSDMTFIRNTTHLIVLCGRSFVPIAN